MLGAFMMACSSDDGDAPVVPPVEMPPPVPERACAEGFALDADGACLSAPAPETCPGGTRPRVGSTTCEPVGWKSACPPGTTRDASGFGCTSPAPPAPAPPAPATCTGATREAYGQAACVPIGDCTAAFPPAGAIVVDASFADGELDATHFRTLESAVAAAGAAATIAVAAGVYDEAITVQKPLTLIGRCAASVEVRSPAGSTKAGIDVRAKGVTVRGMTLTGHVDGVSVSSSGDATVESVVVRDARFAGLYVEGGHLAVKGTKVENTVPRADRRGGFDLAVGVGARASVEDSTLSGGVQGVLAGGAGTKLLMTHVVITGQAPSAMSTARPAGVAAVGESHVSISRSVIRDLVADGGAVVEDEATIEIDETIVRNVHIAGSSARGYGLTSTYAGHMVVRSSLLEAIEGLAVLAADEGSSLQLVDTTVLGPGTTKPPSGALASEGRGGGVVVKKKAKASLDGVAVVGTWGYGLGSDTGGMLELKRSLVDNPRGLLGVAPSKSNAFGLSVSGASATVSDVTITRCSAAGITVGKKGRITGERVFVRDVLEGEVISSGAGLAVGEAGEVDLDASVIDRATAAGVLITRGGNSVVRLARSSVRHTRQTPEGYGHGVTVRLEARVVLTGTSVVDNPGIGIAADGGRALIEGATVARNAVGIHAQSGSFLVELDDPDAESLAEGEVRVAKSTVFTGNATRIGTGFVPVPGPVLPDVP